MSLTPSEIALVAGELRALVGGFVQKIHLAEPRTAFLELRQPGASHLLCVCAEQGRTRIHVATDRPASPEPPYAFQGLLRAEILGAALAAIDAPAGERLVLLRFAGREGARTLACELTGRHGNLFLLAEDGAVKGSAVPNLSEKRDNRAGRPYLRPSAGGAPEPAKAPRFLATGEPFSISAQIERAYAERERREIATERRRAMEQSLRGRLQKLVRTIGKVEGDVERAGKAEEHRRRGELLKANLRSLARGATEVTLTEYTETGVAEVTLRLDPSRAPAQHVEREFHQYRRLLAGQTRARARLAQLAAERDALQGRLDALAATPDEELLRLAPPAGARAPMPRRRREEPRRPWREYVSTSGQRIRVGRGARENDALTFRHSKGNDVWLHARGVVGAHVVVPLEREEPLADETLRDAALLAAQHSEARGDAVEVSWTRVKHVRRQKGAPGAVTYVNDKTVLVRPDPERLARLSTEP